MSHLLRVVICEQSAVNADRRPACAHCTVRASVSQLLVGGFALVALAIPLLEAGHAATAVENLLLAGVERVALRADLGHDAAARLGATGRESVPATTVDCGLLVGGMDVSLHAVLFARWPRLCQVNHC